jgi:hypothetical protein
MITKTPSPVASPLMTATTAGRSGRFGRELRFLLAGLPLGIVSFTVAIAGFSLGVGTLVIWIGLPVLVWTLAAARSFADVERRRIAHATGKTLPAPAYRESGLAAAISDPQRWRDLAHAIVSFPLRVTTFSLAVTWTLGGLGELLYATWSWSLPRDEGDSGLLDLAFGIESEAADIAFNTGIGVVLLATTVPVVRGLVALETSLARALLSNGRRL